MRKHPPTAMRRFREHIDMDRLKTFLADAEPGSKWEIFFLMLCDPAYEGMPFLQVAKKAHVSLLELQSLYTDGMRQLGLLALSNELPEIMADVAEDARSTSEPCPRCDATGIVPFGEADTRICPVCDGDKYVRRTGDKHARDLVFESAKLTNQRGPMVAIQNNINVDDRRMENMLKRTREIVLDKPNMSVIQPPHEGEDPHLP